MKWLSLGSIWLACLLLMACASQPRSVDSTCLEAGQQQLNGQFLLNVRDGRSAQQLLLALQWREQELNFVGFNTVGAKLFSGLIVDGEVIVQRATLYGGPDAGALVWGVLAHQLLKNERHCWQSGGYKVMSEAGQTQLWHAGKLVYISSGPAAFKLPVQKIMIQAQQLN